MIKRILISAFVLISSLLALAICAYSEAEVIQQEIDHQWVLSENLQELFPNESACFVKLKQVGDVSVNDSSQTCTSYNFTVASASSGVCQIGGSGGGGGTDTLANLSCTAGQVAKRNLGNTAWECAADATATGGSGITEVISTSAFTGLGTTSSPLDLAANSVTMAELADGQVTQDKLASNVKTLSSLTCTANQIPKRNTGNSDWICAADATGSGGTTLTAATLYPVLVEVLLAGSNCELATDNTANTATITCTGGGGEGSTAQRVIIPSASTGNLRACTAADVGTVIALDHRNIKVCKKFVDPGHRPVVTSRNFTTADAPSGLSYRGSFSSYSDVPSPAVNNLVFDETHGGWYRYSSSANAWRTTGLVTNWKGTFDSLEAAEDAIEAVGDKFWYTGASDVQIVTAFTAAVADNTHYAWTFQPEIQNIKNSLILKGTTDPSASLGVSGQYYLNRTTGKWFYKAFASSERDDATLTVGEGFNNFGRDRTSTPTFGSIDNSVFTDQGYLIVRFGTTTLIFAMIAENWDYPLKVSIGPTDLQIPQDKTPSTVAASVEGVAGFSVIFIQVPIADLTNIQSNLITELSLSEGAELDINIQRSDGSWLFQSDVQAEWTGVPGPPDKLNIDAQNLDSGLTVVEKNLVKTRLSIQDLINQGIPKVGRLPLATASSPFLLHLTNDYTVGARDDATVTPATHTAAFTFDFFGYSDGEVFPATGTINKRSPLAYLYLTGTSSSYGFDSIASSNAGWIEEFDRVAINGSNYTLGATFVESGAYVRRILNGPTLTAASFAFNPLRSDNTFYFTTAETETVRHGLYENFEEDSEYHYRKVPVRGIDHIDTIGAPTEPPRFTASVAIDNLGRMWSSGIFAVESTVEPTITSSIWDNFYYNQTAALLSDIIDGHFAVVYNTASIIQNQGGTFVSPNWLNLWSYITTHISNTAANRNIRDNTVFMGTYTSEEAAAEARDQYTDLGKTYYYIRRNNSPPHHIREIETFTEGTTVITPHGFWRGPYPITDDILALIKVSQADGGERVNADLTIGQSNTWLGINQRSGEPNYGSVNNTNFESLGYKVVLVRKNGSQILLYMSTTRWNYPKIISLNEVDLEIPSGIATTIAGTDTVLSVPVTSFSNISNFVTHFGIANEDVVAFNIQRSDGEFIFETTPTARELTFGDQVYNVPSPTDSLDTLPETPHEANKLFDIRTDHVSDHIRNDAILSVASLGDGWWGWASGRWAFLQHGWRQCKPFPLQWKCL